MSVRKKIRFEVFKRDSFTCQYCGRQAPDVVLNCDHISPVAKGGDDNILNLVTSCFDCNSGKGDRTLDDATVLAKRKAQLDDLQERREQIEMVMEWQRGLLELKEETVTHLHEYWQELVPGYYLNETGLTGLRKLVKKYSIGIIMGAMSDAVDAGMQNAQGDLDNADVSSMWSNARKFAAVNHDEARQPWLKDAFYIRGIVRNRMEYYSPHEAIRLIKMAFENGADAEELKDIAKQVPSWIVWVKAMKTFES